MPSVGLDSGLVIIKKVFQIVITNPHVTDGAQGVDDRRNIGG